MSGPALRPSVVVLLAFGGLTLGTFIGGDIHIAKNLAFTLAGYVLAVITRAAEEVYLERKGQP